MKLLVVATHPIQYQAPWFRSIAGRDGFELTVGFAHLPSPEEQGIGFGVPFSWDLPLLEGYRWRRLELVGARPALDRFFGLRARGLARLLAEESPDAVLIPGWNSYVLVQALRAARRRGLPVLVRSEANDLRSRPFAVRALQRGLLASCAAGLAIGRANRRFLAARGLPADRIFDAPYFVDNDRFGRQADELMPEREKLRSDLGLSSGAFVALFAGKLVGKKRPLDLVEAAARARRSGAPLELLVAGTGPLETAMKTAAAAAGLPLLRAGFLNQSEIARAYVAADLLVLPSDAGETWGLVVNEAMACGRPAIVSDLAGCTEDLIEAEHTGWSYPCGDVAALAGLLGRAASEPGRVAEMGLCARERVVRQYSVERAVDGTLEALRRVAGQR